MHIWLALQQSKQIKNKYTYKKGAEIKTIDKIKFTKKPTIKKLAIVAALCLSVVLVVIAFFLIFTIARKNFRNRIYKESTDTFYLKRDDIILNGINFHFNQVKKIKPLNFEFHKVYNNYIPIAVENNEHNKIKFSDYSGINSSNLCGSYLYTEDNFNINAIYTKYTTVNSDIDTYTVEIAVSNKQIMNLTNSSHAYTVINDNSIDIMYDNIYNYDENNKKNNFYRTNICCEAHINNKWYSFVGFGGDSNTYYDVYFNKFINIVYDILTEVCGRTNYSAQGIQPLVLKRSEDLHNSVCSGFSLIVLCQ